MPSLADLQRHMAAAILEGDEARLPPVTVAPIPASAALDVHRGTVFGGLITALRLSFPTVDALVGEAFFDQTARAYAAEQPPRRANLSAYGASFPGFLAAYPHAAGLPYLGDVARLDLTVAEALRAPDADVRREWPIEPAVSLSLPICLTVLVLNHPADLIRAGLEADDDDALAAIDLSPSPRHLAVWRSGRTAAVLHLNAPAGAFLGALIDGAAPDDALSAAVALADPAAALQAIQTEVFAARFTQIIQKTFEETRP